MVSWSQGHHPAILNSKGQDWSPYLAGPRYWPLATPTTMGYFNHTVSSVFVWPPSIFVNYFQLFLSNLPCKLALAPNSNVLLRTPTDALSVELRILSFFNMLASMFLIISKLCLASISCLFFKPFLFLRFFQSFLPAISSFSQQFPRFPWFFQACHPCVFHNFPYTIP